MFTVRRHAVMATAADTDNVSMIDPDNGRPHGVTMAIFADIGRLNMLSMLTGCRGAVMATGTVSGYIRMIEIRRCPGTYGMTI
jgi:hypothetical protein